jgi:hypothetical protein
MRAGAQRAAWGELGSGLSGFRDVGPERELGATRHIRVGMADQHGAGVLRN